MNELRGPRVHLRPLSSADTELVLRWRRDPAVAGQMFSDPPTREDHERFLERLRADDDRLEFVIALNEGDLPVGTIGLSHIDRARGEAEYGILIGEQAARGAGIALEASELILDHAFRAMRLRRVVLNVFADNSAALALYRRLGFRLDPAGAGSRLKDGAARETLRMSIEESAVTTAKA